MNINEKINVLKNLDIKNDIQKIYKSIYKIKTDAGVPDNEFDFYITNENGKLWYDLPQCEKNGKQSFYSQEIIYILLFSLISDKSLINYILDNTDDFDNKIIKLFNEQKHMFLKNKKILDLGAHQGFYTIVFSKYFENVICVEPFPQNYLTIELNLLTNNITNVKVVPAFISNENKSGIFSQGEQKYINLTNYSHEHIIQTSKTLNDFEYFLPDIVKIDIEGEEVNSLKSANKIINQHPSFFIELHKELDYNNTLDYNEIKNYINIESYICLGIEFKNNKLNMFNKEYDFNLLKYLFLINK